jgi:hypothetical protein
LSGWITADMSMPGSLNGTYLYFSVQLEDDAVTYVDMVACFRVCSYVNIHLFCLYRSAWFTAYTYSGYVHD